MPAAFVLTAAVSCAPPAAERPALARPPPVAPQSASDDPTAVRELHRLEAQGNQAEQEMNHGVLTKAADALAALPLREPPHVARRDDLVKRFRARSAAVRDDLHRFLFVQLAPLPAGQRQQFLDSGDRGDAKAISAGAAALAEKEFKAQRRYLRATPALRAGAADPLSGLLVRASGNLAMAWQIQFNEAFNVRMRGLLAE